MIVVLRQIEKADGIKTQKKLGSFNDVNDSERLTTIINKLLSNEERYEFDNFVNLLTFSEVNFNANAEMLDYRFMLRAPNDFHLALIKLWDNAKTYGLEFIPENEMIARMLNRGKAIEQYMQVLTDDDFSALSDLNIPLNKDTPIYPDLYSKKLLKAALECVDSPVKLAEEFNHLSVQFNKRANFKPHYFTFLIDPSRTYSTRRWYYSIAIEILLKYGKNPEEYAPLQIIVEHWLRLHKQVEIEKTLGSFDKSFHKSKEKEIAHNIIRRYFLIDSLLKMGNFPDWVEEPLPSLAIEKWIKKWKKTNKDSDSKKALNDFAKEFPLYANNKYFEKAISLDFTH